METWKENSSKLTSCILLETQDFFPNTAEQDAILHECTFLLSVHKYL